MNKTLEYTVDSLGNKIFKLNGKLHREDGPAIEYANGEKQWFLNGKLHRIDGPAVERANGTKEWWFNGKLHREDGPAIEYADGEKQWFLYDKPLTETEFNNKANNFERNKEIEEIENTILQLQKQIKSLKAKF